ncbi:SDR family oxidoreductase [Stackebrandtia nassauensis]|uniref:Short-chain dehydrogenase/reductase SDR n=1 Tax=Stackebrandtia nassauensis (strain DSM 44728 / CIP 108903 / NRRL B-16338 / NBRC 102104 / LLR-40K-21) TaxID=446470 RepID=D3PY93_STANL|nr:SDR family oxidoreductase [Stackebrandtia nassauensis]ADD41460.1 short-chain dehydrogenase/reductase SDR [Stackebrandtia nassauensis DSM 44728]
MTNNIALITGANKGIGLEIARGLGTAGLTVLIGARSTERGETAAETLRGEGIDARFCQLEVTDADSIAAAAKRIDAEHGRLDVLVNNAGITRVGEPVWSTSGLTVAAARGVLEVNVLGVLGVTNALLPLLRRSAAARVVNVSSEVGSNTVALHRNGPLWHIQGGIYAASKAALNRLTVSYAKEFWDSPIRFNVVTPGYCATDLNDHSGHRTAEQGAAIAVKVALLGADSPNGGFHSDEEPWLLTNDGVVPW